MNNEEEKKGAMDATGWILTIFFVVFWALVLDKLPDNLFWPAIVFEGFLVLAFYGAITTTATKQNNTEEKVYHITPEQRAIEQERVLKAEAERLKVRDDAKKAEREKLARLLDEL